MTLKQQAKCMTKNRDDITKGNYATTGSKTFIGESTDVEKKKDKPKKYSNVIDFILIVYKCKESPDRIHSFWWRPSEIALKNNSESLLIGSYSNYSRKPISERVFV